MKLTVAICTWNRAVLLSATLEQLAHARPPHVPWEVLVVNNNSSDGTDRVLDNFVARLPLRRAWEPTPGLSHARNAAVRNATGDYILWTDDDVLVDVEWLLAYERAIARSPGAAVFGGPVRPRFEGAPPPWLSAVWQEVSGAFAIRELGAEPFALDDTRIPYGPNFVLRTQEQRRFSFDPALGRIENSGALGEETAVIRAVLASGHTGWWVPDAIVDHWIPRERQTIRYLRSYYALLGRTRASSLAAASEAPLPRHSTLSAWRKILRAEVRYALARLRGGPHRWVKPLVEASLLRGAIMR